MRPPRIPVVLACAAALAVCAAPAGAAPPWSEPQVVPGSERPPADAPGLALGVRGAGLLGWSVSEDPSSPDSIRDGRLAAVAARAAPSPEISLDPYDLAAPPAAYGATRGILLQSRVVRREPAVASRLVVVFARADGVLGDRRPLDRSVVLGGADLAANDRGDAVAAWIERRGPAAGRREHDRLWVALRRPNGRFGIPRVLAATGEITAVRTAVGPRGDMVVAYERRRLEGGRPGARRVHARVRRAGRRFGPATAVGPSDGTVDLAAAVSSRGRVYVVWGTQDGGEELGRPWRVLAAMRPAGPRRFGSATLLDPGEERARAAGRVVLAVGPDQSATVAWSNVARAGDRPTFPVRTATTDRRGTFAPAAPLAAAEGGVGAVAIAPSGATTVLWTAAGDDASVMAATRPPGAPRFSGPETVSAAPAAPSVAPPALAVDPRDGRLLAAWVGAGGTGVLTSSRPPAP